MYQQISYEVKNDLAWIGFGLNEKKSMTTFTRDSLMELKDAVADVTKNQGKLKGLIFFSHKPGVFLAGMDISVINSIKSEAEALRALEETHPIFNAVDDLKIPTVALVDGVCLGGGLELSLACKKIFVSDNPKTALGLPEVMLGILPGFGGTYRLPRKVGLTGALDMVLTGRQIKGKNAVKMGLAEVMLPTERMIELAPEYLLNRKTGKKKSFKEEFQTAAVESFLARKIIFQKAREKVMQTSKGFYPAPLKILEVIEGGFGKGRTDALALEQQGFAELSQSSQSKNLQHVFFLQDQSKKLENKDQVRSVKRGAVLGAGVMGGGIAWLFAQNNQSPVMKDITPAALELGLKQASQNFSGALKKRRMTEDEFNRKMRSIEPTMNFESFKSVDLVAEAVVEIMDVKKKVFAEVEGYVQKDCLLTSNTSSLSIEEMSKALVDSSRFAGLHFFNPVNKMPLVEIITHEKCKKETIDALVKWTLDSKKTPIIVKDGPGFLVNRILAPYLNEAGFLLEEGVSMDEIEEAALNFGMPMGPARLMDEVGIDVCMKVGNIVHAGLGERMTPSTLAQKLYEAKFLGKKNSKGFFLYDEKGKVTGKNPEVAKFLPTKKKHMEESEIQMRLFLPMVNEAAYIFADRIVSKAETVDIGLIFGLGFPPFKGGLCRWADTEGLDQIATRLANFAKDVNKDRYAIAPFLTLMIADKKKFYDL